MKEPVQLTGDVKPRKQIGNTKQLRKKPTKRRKRLQVLTPEVNPKQKKELGDSGIVDDINNYLLFSLRSKKF